MNRVDIKKLVLLLLSLMVPFASHADEKAVARMMIYIQPQEYSNPIKLWEYYGDYWLLQGPFVEAAAKQVLGAEFGDVGMCSKDLSPSQTMVWLRPRLYYNPQLQVFYGSIKAVSYTADGKPIATYVGESEKQGFLDVLPDRTIKMVYQMAMQDLSSKMKADSSFMHALDVPLSEKDVRTPCELISTLPNPWFKFNSFQ